MDLTSTPISDLVADLDAMTFRISGTVGDPLCDEIRKALCLSIARQRGFLLEIDNVNIPPSIPRAEIEGDLDAATALLSWAVRERPNRVTVTICDEIRRRLSAKYGVTDETLFDSPSSRRPAPASTRPLSGPEFPVGQPQSSDSAPLPLQSLPVVPVVLSSDMPSLDLQLEECQATSEALPAEAK